MKNLIRKILKEELDWFESEDFESSPTEKFLYDKFMECKLEKVENKYWLGWTRYVDKNGKILFLDNIETGKKDTILYFDYDEIYKNLEEMGLSDVEMKILVKDMLYETHKRKVLTAQMTFLWVRAQLYETHKRKVLTAQSYRIFFGGKLYETHKRK